ncbi:MAG TPA: hypothetical protein VMH90_00090 [Thermoplasmata archaeon]|nr:hypothetical protein [Thermoplasmata archaeon]
MALFSELDWVVIAGVGGFIFFGQGNGAALRQLGRWYGRLVRLKQELLAEFTAAADLPLPQPGRPLSIRQALLESEPSGGRVSGIPAAVSRPPTWTPVPTAPAPASVYGMGPETWSMARPGPSLEVRP